MTSRFTNAGIHLMLVGEDGKIKNSIERNIMKRIIKLSLYVLLGCGLMASYAPASQEIEVQKVDQEERLGEIKELTIRNSGFLSKSDIVIRYRDEDKKIIEVIENGKKLPSSEFSRYESLIREVLEIPQIDRLIPEIERAKRRAESARISEESKIREMIELRSRLEDLNSDRARRFRDLNELMLMEELNSMTERISESKELSQEEKIRQMWEAVEKIQALKVSKEAEERSRSLAEFGAVNAARRLIVEINKLSAISNERKIEELNKVLQNMREMEAGRQGHRDLVEVQVAETIRKMMQEVLKQKELTDQERKKELEKLLGEARKMELKDAQLRLEIEKFTFDLHQLLEKEGLLPVGKAQFELRMNVCTIDGKRLPKEIHQKILKLCEESLNKKFDRDTKIILTLNEER